MQSITMSQMLKVIGITKSTFLKAETALGLQVPRNAQGHRAFDSALVSQLLALQTLAEQLGQALPDLARDLQQLSLRQARTEYGLPQVDAYLQEYLPAFYAELAEAGLELAELRQLEARLELALPRDRQGNLRLNRDWRRYFQAVKEKTAQGKDLYWLVYNLPTPNQIRPQLASASAYGPEY